MSAHPLAPSQLRLTVDPHTLGFTTTAELVGTSVPWIGQDRAATAAQFGLNMAHPDYHLFVVGEAGCGKTSLLLQAMQQAASTRATPPDWCYVHPPHNPERPVPIALPSGSGQHFRDAVVALCTTLATELPSLVHHARAPVPRSTTKNIRIATHTTPGNDSSNARLQRQQAAIRPAVQTAMQTLRSALETHLRTQTLDTSIQTLVTDLATANADASSPAAPTHPLALWLAQVEAAIVENVGLFDLYSSGGTPSTPLPLNTHPIRPTSAAHRESDEAQDVGERQDALADWLASLQVHIAVSHHGLHAAPVIVDNNPSQRSLFGFIDAPSDSDMLPDVSCLHAGNLHQAHGGFLLLHLRDIMATEGLWERLRRFLRHRQLQFDDASPSDQGADSGRDGTGSATTLQPQAVDIDVKIVLIGSFDAYNDLHEHDPETARRFQVKVDFADSMTATASTYRASAAFIAHTCQRYQLPHFSAQAVAHILEQTHHDAQDQYRQSALFGTTETLIVESAAACCARHGKPSTAPVLEALVQADDVQAALQARMQRHNHTEAQMLAAIAEGEHLITLGGTALGQINALTQVDSGDYQFGLPVRITARTFAGHEGLLNIEREVNMSGPIHDKGVLILHSYLTTLFSDHAPLALNASIVFEQEYNGVEGDSASCAELYALLSSLSGLPLQQGIAVTGALNQRGDVLPIGGINDKIEGWFNVCLQAGLTGEQGVLIPARNQRHLMLSPRIQQAVAQGQFHVYAMHHVSEGMALLAATASGMQPHDHSDNRSPHDIDEATVLHHAQATLVRYRRACQKASSPRPRRPRGML